MKIAFWCSSCHKMKNINCVETIIKLGLTSYVCIIITHWPWQSRPRLVAWLPWLPRYYYQCLGKQPPIMSSALAFSLPVPEQARWQWVRRHRACVRQANQTPDPRPEPHVSARTQPHSQAARHAGRRAGGYTTQGGQGCNSKWVRLAQMGQIWDFLNQFQYVLSQIWGWSDPIWV